MKYHKNVANNKPLYLEGFIVFAKVNKIFPENEEEQVIEAIRKDPKFITLFYDKHRSFMEDGPAISYMLKNVFKNSAIPEELKLHEKYQLASQDSCYLRGFTRESTGERLYSDDLILELTLTERKELVKLNEVIHRNNRLSTTIVRDFVKIVYNIKSEDDRRILDNDVELQEFLINDFFSEQPINADKFIKLKEENFSESFSLGQKLQLLTESSTTLRSMKN
jgi:hypothetical protein